MKWRVVVSLFVKMRKGVQKVIDLLEDSQLLGDEASVLANLKLPDARIKPCILLLLFVKNSFRSCKK